MTLPNWWPLAAGGAVVVALAALGWALRRRGQAADRWEDSADDISTEAMIAVPPPRAAWPPAPPPPPPPPAAVIEMVFNPRRGGTNLLSAAVDYEIGLRNAGDAPARGIKVDIQMFCASAAQDAQVAALFATPLTRSVVTPFDLQPGQHIELAGMVMLPRAALNIITVEGRQLFVPILAVRAVYDRGQGEVAQAAAAHVIGIERGAGAKLAPFRADLPPRMFEQVGARLLEPGTA